MVRKTNIIQRQASPKDIEDLAEAGRLAHICPYFGSRRAIPQAEVKLHINVIPLLLNFYAAAGDFAV